MKKKNYFGHFWSIFSLITVFPIVLILHKQAIVTRKLVIQSTSKSYPLLSFVIKVDLDTFGPSLYCQFLRIIQESKSNTILSHFSQSTLFTTTSLRIQHLSISDLQIHSFQLFSLPLEYSEPTADLAKAIFCF